MSTLGPRRWGSTVVAVLFVALGIQALIEAAPTLTGKEDTPMLLGVLQLLVAVSALAAGHGAWHRTRWGPWAAVSYGAVTGTTVALLGPILDLPREAWAGLAASGVLVLAIGLVLGRYLQQVLRRGTRTAETAMQSSQRDGGDGAGT